MARTYIMYGPPDQVEGDAQPGTPSQIWRYNYLPGFHSSAEFEFTRNRGNNPAWRKNINYPPPLATYTGIPAEANSLADALRRENQGRGQSPAAATSTSPGFPSAIRPWASIRPENFPN